MPNLRVSKHTLQAISDAATKFGIQILDQSRTKYLADGAARIYLSGATVERLHEIKFANETYDEVILRLCRGGVS